MYQISLEWLRLQDGGRLRVICRNGIPIHLPNEWIRISFENSDSPSTAWKYAQCLVRFYQWMEIKNINLMSITKKDLLLFREALSKPYGDDEYLFQKERITENTQYQILRCVIQFINWALEANDYEPIFKRSKNNRSKSKGMLTGISSLELTGLNKGFNKEFLKNSKKKLPKYLKESEVNNIREWINERWKNDAPLRNRNRAIIELMYDTGLRIGELVSLTLDEYDDENRLIIIPFDEDEYKIAKKTGQRRAFQKTGERPIVISTETARLLNEYISLYRPREATKIGHKKIFCTHRPKKYRGNPMTIYGVEKLFRTINLPPSLGGCVLIRKAHPHILRHTAATSLRRNGADSKSIQDQLGHESYETTKIYDKLAPEQRREKLDAARNRGGVKNEDW